MLPTLGLVGVVLLLLTSACGQGGEAELKAYSERNGVLHVVGTGWHDCAQVTVILPKPVGVGNGGGEEREV